MRAIILLAVLGAVMAVPENPGRIIGGSPIDIQAYPYMANMQYLLWGFWWVQSCGGNVLTSTSILSAAHCFYGDQFWEWRAALGSSFSTSGNIHVLSSIVMHPEYNHDTLNNDVAIVKLQNPTSFSNSIAPANIAGPNYRVADGTTVTHIGWGQISVGGPSSNVLQHVDIQIINQEICVQRYAYLKTLPGFAHWPDITDGMICAGILNQGGKDACGGDSGGPLAHGDVVVGITSWGYSCADAFYPGVSARVSSYTNWIVANA